MSITRQIIIVLLLLCLPSLADAACSGSGSTRTCTATPESADAGNGGVGYWATDQGSWNQSASNPQGVQQNGSDGVLYRCSATNTWTVAYTPYTYPHPLQGSVAGSPTPRFSPSFLLRVAEVQP